MELPFLSPKKKAEESKGRGYVPLDRVRELMNKGFSEIDSIDVLRREGFSPDEIDKALTQVVKEGVVGSNNNYPNQQGGQGFDQSRRNFGSQQSTPTFPPKKEEHNTNLKLPSIEDLQGSNQSAPEMPETSLPEEYYQGYPTEEYIDYVVQERTQDIMDQLNGFSVRNKELESRVREMSERVKELSTIRTDEQKVVLRNVEELKESLNDVNMRMGGLEKAFKDTLPALIESVRALSDLVQRLKRES